jgi:plasmid maintenance system antidote protein VapI
MGFSAKDAKELENEFEETKIPRTYMANLLGINQSYITQFITGQREPSDDVLRRMRAVFTMIRAAHMENNGGFALNKKNMDMLRRNLAEMEKSVVRRKQTDAGGRRKCATTVN